MIQFSVYLIFVAYLLTYLQRKPLKFVLKHFTTVTSLTPVIPKHVFIELMKTATTSVEFSLNDIMYR